MNRFEATLIVLMAAVVPAVAQDTNGDMVIQGKPGDAGELSLSIANEARAAMDRGVKWLLEQQNEDGHWSNKDFPALTALPLWVLAKSAPQNQEAIDKAVKFILTSVHDDGSIWSAPSVEQKGGGLANYNTAVCMVSLNAVGDPQLVPVVQKARRFIAGTQHFGGDDYHGGMGYDPDTGRPYADLSNSYMAYEAMRLTDNVEDQRKAGTYTNAAGELRFRSYGSMTYAGLLSLMYADVNKDDPRVSSAFDWASRHWTLEENPGVGNDGLFYFYNVLSKSLAAYGRDRIVTGSGAAVNWRAELIKKLLSLQKIDPKTGTGYWLNESGRWWEADPVLVTSYSLLALEIALNP